MEELQNNNCSDPQLPAFVGGEAKLVVLDDDPTGIQTVHGCLLITQWDKQSVRQGFEDKQHFFYILTNTRAMTREEAERVTDVMRQVLVEHGLPVFSKTPFCPAFIEAGRVAIEGVHYMKVGERLVPVSETEFARDNVFAYHSSVLHDYIKEKGANPDDYEIVNALTYDDLRCWWSSKFSTLRSAMSGDASLTKNPRCSMVIRFLITA